MFLLVIIVAPRKEPKMLAIAQYFAHQNRIDPEKVSARTLARKRAQER